MTSKIMYSFHDVYGGRIWLSGSYLRSVRAEQDDEICACVRARDSLYLYRCLVLVYPRSLSRFALLVLAVSLSAHCTCSCDPTHSSSLTQLQAMEHSIFNDVVLSHSTVQSLIMHTAGTAKSLCIMRFMQNQVSHVM